MIIPIINDNGQSRAEHRQIHTRTRVARKLNTKHKLSPITHFAQAATSEHTLFRPITYRRPRRRRRGRSRGRAPSARRPCWCGSPCPSRARTPSAPRWRSPRSAPGHRERGERGVRGSPEIQDVWAQRGASGASGALQRFRTSGESVWARGVSGALQRFRTSGDREGRAGCQGQSRDSGRLGRVCGRAEGGARSERAA